MIDVNQMNEELRIVGQDFGWDSEEYKTYKKYCYDTQCDKLKRESYV